MARTPSPSSSASRAPKSPLFCGTCFRPSDEHGRCGNFAMGCPPLKQLEADQVVTLSCEPCGRTRIVPAANLMGGKRLDELRGMCGRDECQARVIPSA